MTSINEEIETDRNDTVSTISNGCQHDIATNDETIATFDGHNNHLLIEEDNAATVEVNCHFDLKHSQIQSVQEFNDPVMRGEIKKLTKNL